MGSVRVLFTRRHHPGSVAIRAATWSAWSHVDLVDDLGTAPVLIGAIALKGVVAESLERRLTLASRAALVKFPAANPAAVIAAARSQLGKPYDWSGIAGLVARNRDWQEDDSWFCSELVPWAFAQSGSPIFRQDMVGRITPQHLWMLAHPYQRPERPLELLNLM
ncbi:hypothetical protein [Pseudomonas anguilliseptica]|uniref:Permuted papain-like amidase enzyme, YaeF/YiiX, C92 family n=1 Tax=Pseudomonas anguilliseptica TaxID=53406 RepID=A0A1H4Y3A9_PSEAG|nr:hypothetical protein [Pseudomonas anguilliseptica]SED11558.1 Permuted papain-like amidase enzyme, YaeF/YiiX, C92 family [Pseudomonas anguilliseptica]